MHYERGRNIGPGAEAEAQSLPIPTHGLPPCLDLSHLIFCHCARKRHGSRESKLGIARELLSPSALIRVGHSSQVAFAKLLAVAGQYQQPTSALVDVAQYFSKRTRRPSVSLCLEGGARYDLHSASVRTRDRENCGDGATLYGLDIVGMTFPVKSDQTPGVVDEVVARRGSVTDLAIKELRTPFNFAQQGPQRLTIV